MSRPKLKLPKNPADALALLSPTSISLAPPAYAACDTHATEVALLPPGCAEEPSVNTAVNIFPCEDRVAPGTRDARLRSIADGIRGRFRPVNIRWFATYAKNLSRLTDQKMMAARETLAKIYGFRNLHDLTHALTLPDEPGPFDDKLFEDDWNSEIVQAALMARWERIHDIVFMQNPRLRHSTLCTPANLQDISLFCTPGWHRDSIRTLELPEFASESKHRRLAAEALSH